MDFKQAAKGLHTGIVYATMAPMLYYYIDNPKLSICGTILFIGGCIIGYLLEGCSTENNNNNLDEKGE